MKLVKQNKETIGLALTEEEMFVTIQALTLSRSLIDTVRIATDSTKSEVISKSITNLESDYRSIYEKYKEKLARGEETHVEEGRHLSQNCEVCE